MLGSLQHLTPLSQDALGLSDSFISDLREREASGLEAGPTKHQAALFVNMKGCGYPPTVNCANWTR